MDFHVSRKSGMRVLLPLSCCYKECIVGSGGFSIMTLLCNNEGVQELCTKEVKEENQQHLKAKGDSMHVCVAKGNCEDWGW